VVLSLDKVLEEWGGVEVSAMDVYSDMFKLGDGLIQKSGEDSGEFKANPLIYWKNDNDEHGYYRVLFEDTFEKYIKESQKADFTLINGLTYFGKKNIQQNASKMFAMIFDLDDVDADTVTALMSGSIVADVYPHPNYVILSGSGLHLYYLFDEPISLFPNIKLQLKELKYALTDILWNQHTSRTEQVQHQGINQGFKVIGGRTKPESNESRMRAFRMNTHPFSLKELCEYVPEKFRVDESKLFKESKYSLAEAEELFPEWFEKVVINGDRTLTKWDIAGKVNGENPYALYDWWLRQIKSGATFGHRYFSIMALTVYAVKNDVPYERLVDDARSLVPFLNALNPSKPFTIEDVNSALECYDDRYARYPRKELERLTAIDIPPNKRNYRTRKEHLQADYWINRETGRPMVNVCKQNRELALQYMRANGEIKGRPTAKGIVEKWRSCNPDGRKADCIRETKLDPKTVRKWWSEKVEK
jgi:hypothetical protein